MSPLLFHLLLLAVGVGALYLGAEWLVRGAARLAGALGVSPIVIGLTVVSLGTSAPELAVSLLAAFRGDADIAVGNVMGSNLANIGLILGLTALIRPLSVAARVVRREVPLMLLITVLLYPFILDHGLGRLDGLALLALLAGYLVIVFRSAEDETPEVLGEYADFVRETEEGRTTASPRDVGLVALGTGGLVLGGSAIVEGAVYVAGELGISELVISLSLVAIGTSLPELATSLVAALREESDIAVGNIVGSNIFNIGAILGITSLAAPIAVNPQVLVAHLPAVLALSVLLLPIARTGSRIGRREGGVLLACYLGVMIWLFNLGAVG